MGSVTVEAVRAQQRRALAAVHRLGEIVAEVTAGDVADLEAAVDLLHGVVAAASWRASTAAAAVRGRGRHAGRVLEARSAQDLDAWGWVLAGVRADADMARWGESAIAEKVAKP